VDGGRIEAKDLGLDDQGRGDTSCQGALKDYFFVILSLAKNLFLVFRGVEIRNEATLRSE